MGNQQSSSNRGTNNPVKTNRTTQRGAHHQGPGHSASTPISCMPIPDNVNMELSATIVEAHSAKSSDKTKECGKEKVSPTMKGKRGRDDVENEMLLQDDQMDTGRSPKMAKCENHTGEKGKPIDLGELLLENSWVLQNIQTKVAELSEITKSVEERLRKIEEDRASDRELINDLHEHCHDNRVSINFLHGVITDTNSNLESAKKGLDGKLDLVTANHSNLVDTVQKLSRDQKRCEQDVKKLSDLGENTAKALSDKGIDLAVGEEFAIDCTIIAVGVRYTVDEDLNGLA